MHAEYAQRSPYTLRIGERGARLELGGEYVAPVVVPPRPRIYDMQTADGVPYWKIALLHLDSIASTVVQKCIYWGTPRAVRVLRHRADARRADGAGQDARDAGRGLHRRA